MSKQKKKKSCFGWRQMITDLLLLYPYYPTALHQLHGSYRMYVLSSSLLQEMFSLAFQPLLHTKRSICFCLFGGEMGIKGKKNPMNLFLISSFLPTFSLWWLLSLKASSAFLYCCANVITFRLPERTRSIHVLAFYHFGVFWACCCLQGSCLARTSTLLGPWTWEEPQHKSHFCHDSRWGVGTSEWVGTSRPVGRCGQCCAPCFHFVSADTSRASVMYWTSVCFDISSWLIGFRRQRVRRKEKESKQIDKAKEKQFLFSRPRLGKPVECRQLLFIR